MKKTMLFITVALLALSITGCDFGKKDEINVSQLFPFEVGNYWKYKGYGNEFADLERKVLFKEDTRVQIMEVYPGTTMAVIYEIDDQRAAVVYSEGEFYEEVNILDREDMMEQPVMAAPVKEGNSWESNGNKYTIEKLDQVVETDAGTFEGCVLVKVEYPQNTGVLFSYYKPGLGLIRQDYTDTESEETISTVLSDFQVKGYN